MKTSDLEPLRAFRQSVYGLFGRQRDALFEVLDAFQRGWAVGARKLTWTPTSMAVLKLSIFCLRIPARRSKRALTDRRRSTTVCESVRANLRVLVKRLLRRYGYPPDKQEKATQTVLEQAELWGKEWAA